MAKGYQAWQLEDQDRSRLLAAIPPLFPDVIAHHITYRTGVADSTDLPEIYSARVIGHCVDPSGVQCLVVEVDGHLTRRDGGTYHCTWSIDRSAGKKPFHSNAAIAAFGWEEITPAINIAVNPGFFPGS